MSARMVLDPVETGTKFRATLDGTAELTLDDVKGGPDPNPVQILLAALGACTGMDVISILRKKRQVVLGYEIEVDGERRAEYPRVFTKIVVVHRLRGHDLDRRAIADAIRVSETKYCTVHGMLGAVAEITSRIEIVPA